MTMNALGLRQVNPADIWMLWEWRNSERIRSVSGSDREISRNEHAEWFERTYPAMRDLTVVVSWSRADVGWFQVERWDPISRQGEWGIGLGLPGRPGLGAAMPLLALAHSFDRLDATAMTARVLDVNPGVVSLMRRLGIPMVGAGPPVPRANGTESGQTIYRLERAEWPDLWQRGLALLPSEVRHELERTAALPLDD